MNILSCHPALPPTACIRWCDDDDNNDDNDDDNNDDDEGKGGHDNFVDAKIRIRIHLYFMWCEE